MLNVDTHVLLYAVTGALGRRETRLLSANRWSMSAIVLWELSMLTRLGRIEYAFDDPELSLLLSRIQLWPIDLAVCRKLKELDFSSDPADEIIAATSLVHRIPLMTRDRKIRSSKVLQFAG